MKLLRRILDREPRHRHASTRRARPVPDLPPSVAADVTGGDTIEARRAAIPAAWRTRATAVRTRARGAVGGHQHGQGRSRVAVIAVAFAVLMLMAGGTGAISSANGATRHDPTMPSGGNSVQASDHPSLNLPTATATPAPAPPSVASSAPLQSHEIFGYAPYWTLPQSSSFDVNDLTTLAYFSVDANPNGTLDESGAGWNGYESQDLANLVTRAHAAGDRVVLTVTCFSQSALDTITSDPTAPATLSAALVNAVSAKNLDGVNFDFEGEGSADQGGLTSLITQVSHALHAANPHWQVTMATYASAAADPSGFYNIAALAPALDGFFVMAYDMNNRTEPSATAPLVGGGFNDTEALQQYTAVVPASKVILGVPYYGYDWSTTDGTSTAQAIGGESPLSDGVIAASGHPTYWDASTDTVWTSYQVGTQWHETYFDNPTSLAMKAQLANSYHVAGLGIWALGMDGNNPAMLAALLGNAPAAKDYTTGPTTTTPTTAPAGTGFTSNGTYNGVSVPLNPINPPPPGGTAQYVGSLSAFTTTDPPLACLQTGLPLAVWSFSNLPGVYVVVAAQPQDCAAAMWSFAPPTSQIGSGTSPPSSSTTSTDPGSSTSTTDPSSTTTTSTTSTSSTTTTSTSSTTSTTTTTTTLP